MTREFFKAGALKANYWFKVQSVCSLLNEYLEDYKEFRLMIALEVSEGSSRFCKSIC